MNWTGLCDTQTAAASVWTSVGKGGTKNFDLDNSTAYRYYKITIVKSASPSGQGVYIEFKQIKYGYKPTGMGTVVVSGAVPDISGLKISDGVAFTLAGDITLAADCELDDLGARLQIDSGATVNLNGHNLTVGGLAGDGTITAGLQDLTSPDPNGERVSSPTTFSGTNPTTAAINLFNNNYVRGDNTKRVLIARANLPLAVTYDFGAETPRKVNMYKVYVGPLDSLYNRGPKTWTFEGTNDTNGTWNVLHSIDNETWPTTQETRTYSFKNDAAYRYYRITFTAATAISQIPATGSARTPTAIL